MPNQIYPIDSTEQQLLSWINDIYNSLMSLNDYTPSRTSDHKTTQLLKAFSKNTTLANNFLSKSEKNIIVEQAELLGYQVLSNQATAVMQTQSKNAKTQSDALLIQKQTQNQTTSEQLTDNEKLIAQHDKLDANAGNQTAFDIAPKFPVQGQEYISETKQLTDLYNQTKVFVTKSQYKPVSNNTLNSENQVVSVSSTASDSFAKPQTLFKSWALSKKTLDANGDPILIADPSKNLDPGTYTDFINDILARQQKTDSVPGAYRFFIEKLHGRYSDSTPYKKNPITSSKTKSEIPTNLTNRMLFPAYLGNYYDNYNVSQTEYDFIGRPESTPIYSKTKRSMHVDFMMLADYSTELMVVMSKYYESLQAEVPHMDFDAQLDAILNQFPDWGLGYIPLPKISNKSLYGISAPGLFSDSPDSLWYKMTFLAQCCYPYYRTDGKMKEQPFVRIRIADFYDVIGTITSLQFELSELEQVMIDTNPSSLGNIPLAIKVNIDINIYHDYESNSTFFGFYNRREFDKGTMDPVTGAGIDTRTLDPAKTAVKKKSPANINPTYVNEGMLDTPTVLDTLKQTVKNAASNFKFNFNALETVGMKVSDLVLKNKAKDAVNSFMRLSSVLNDYRILMGGSPNNNPTNTVPLLPNQNTNPSTIKNQTVANSSTNLNPLQTDIEGKITNNTQALLSNIGTLGSDAQMQLKQVKTQLKALDESGGKFSLNDVTNDVTATINIAKQAIPTKTIADIIQEAKSRITTQTDNSKNL